MTTSTPTIDALLNLVPDAAGSVLVQLRAHPQLANKQDRHGYSLLHAAASYEQLDLLRALVEEFHLDPNITDEDGETALFNAESVALATELVNLGVSVDATNSDGQTAAEKLDDEDEQPEVAAYLRQLRRLDSSDRSSTDASNDASSHVAPGSRSNGDNEDARAPPPLPNGVQVAIGSMHADDVGEAPDPAFRRRIEELAARQDFDAVESQDELRDLISDAVSGLGEPGQGAASRRRVG